MSRSSSDLPKLLEQVITDGIKRFQYCNRSDFLENNEIFTFKQSWGGEVITEVYTIVVFPNSGGVAGVYFDGRFCYKTEICQAFVEDLNSRQLKSLSENEYNIKA